MDNTTTIILPLAVIVIGLIIAKTAPFGGGPREIGRASQNLSAATVDEAAGEVFSDGFESGDTSAWTDEDPT